MGLIREGNMKKKIYSLCTKAGVVSGLAVLGLCLALSGCGNKSSGVAGAQTEAGDQEAGSKAAEAINDLMNQSKAEDEAADAAAETEIEKAEDETTGVAEEAAKASQDAADDKDSSAAKDEEESADADSEEEPSGKGTDTDTAYYGPQPGELDPAIEGAYGSGRTVVFAGSAFLHQPDGIYLLAGHREPELLVKLKDQNTSEICTDGYMLYYCDDGKVMALDLTAKGLKPEQISDNSYKVPDGSSVVGAGHYHVYVESFGTVRDDMYDPMMELPQVTAMNLKTGIPEETYEGYYGGCRGGNTFIKQDSYDVSPGPLKIFDFQGEVIVDESSAWTVRDDMGLLWYSVTGEESGRSNAVLYKLDVDGPEEVLHCEQENGTYYGISPNGFLASVYFEPSDPEAAISGDPVTYMDLRTLQPIEKDLKVPGGDVVYWYGGYTRGGKDYYLEANRIFRKDEDGLTDIFDIPADVYAGGVYLTEDRILLEDIEGSILIFDYDQDSGLHTLPVMSLVKTKRDIGTEGLMVTDSHTEFMTDGLGGWLSLNSALDKWNQDAASRAEKLANEVYELAETQAKDGFFDNNPDPKLKAGILGFIQRADTNAFTFMEHERIDPVIGPRNYEIKTGYNFDPKDGHAIALDEVITDLNKLAELMIEGIERIYPNHVEWFSAADFVDELLSRRSLVSSPEFSWVLGYEGVSFYYNGNVNFPLSRGTTKFYVSFSEHPELFEKKWMQVPESYSYDIIIDDYYAEDYQTESEHGIQTVLVTASPAVDADGYPQNYMDGLDIWVSEGPIGSMRTGESRTVEIFSDTVSGMILHRGKKNYLLVQYNGDSMGLEVFAIDSDPKTVCEIGQGALPQYCPENNMDAYSSYVAHTWLSNPDFFTVLSLDEEDNAKGFHIRNFCRLKDGVIEKY